MFSQTDSTDHEMEAHASERFASISLNFMLIPNRIFSFFFPQVKLHWIGDNYRKEGASGNDVHRTNVPDIRVAFRHATLVEELSTLCKAARV